MWFKRDQSKVEVELGSLSILHYEKCHNLYRVQLPENQVSFILTLIKLIVIYLGGCEPSAESPLVLHKHVYGEQRRLHVIENTLSDDPFQSFNMTLEYTDINGPVKGVYYRHALSKFRRIICLNLFVYKFIYKL